MSDDIDWEDVRRVYDVHTIPIAALCAQFGIAKSALTKARLDGGWTPRPTAAPGGFSASCRRTRPS